MVQWYNNNNNNNNTLLTNQGPSRGNKLTNI